MNILESYSLSCGAKINSPHIYASYFPIPFEKYISFHANFIGNAKDYPFYQDVINILLPVLEKHNIRIIQLGDPKDNEYSGVVSVKGQTNVNQSAYVVQNSLLHFGCEGFLIHIAAGFDIPIVVLFSNNHVNYEKPLFGTKEKQIFISSYDKLGLKPSYTNDENPKTISYIMPEEVANAIFKLLGLSDVAPFETLYCGKKYSNFAIQESIPNHDTLAFNPELPVEIRADSPEYDERFFFHQLSRYKKAIVIVEKPININILKQLKANISMLVYKVTKDDYIFFLEDLKALGCKLILFSELPNEEIDKLKIKYYTINIINQMELPSQNKIDELKKDIDNLYYRSSKITSSKNKFYYSPAAVEKNIPMNHPYEYQKVIDDPLFWKNLEFYTIIKKK